MSDGTAEVHEESEVPRKRKMANKARLHLVSGIVRDAWCAVEEVPNAMTAE